jgi:2-polyprenyl-3-methyl-5-hydroxy-6-metoxy-1,4-benzoquinol methylase
MMKVQFGCGDNRLYGWVNHDIDVDVRFALPYQENTADYVFCEHMLEHLTHRQAVFFLKECHRIINPGGVLRIAIPSIEHLWETADEDYLNYLKSIEAGDGTKAGAVLNIVCRNNHLSVWTINMLEIFLCVAGFSATRRCQVGESEHLQLRGIDGHGVKIGEKYNKIETVVAEGIK